MIREGRLGHPDLGEVRQTIADFGTVGTIPVLTTLLVLYALTYALHLPVSNRRSAWPLSALTAGLLLIMSPLIVSRARRPPASDSRVLRTCQKISHDPNAGLRLDDGDWFGISAASLGDLDGDGVTDLAVGVAGDQAVYLLMLDANGLCKEYQKIASGNGSELEIPKHAGFGWSVTSLGDLNGDGVTDLAVGAPDTVTGPGYIRGIVYILMMESSGTVASYQKVASGIGGGPDLELGDRFGASLASMDDIDGDKVTDLAYPTWRSERPVTIRAGSAAESSTSCSSALMVP